MRVRRLSTADFFGQTNAHCWRCGRHDESERPRFQCIPSERLSSSPGELFLRESPSGLGRPRPKNRGG